MARAGIISEEMAFCAAREGLDPELVRSEVRAHTGRGKRERKQPRGSCLLPCLPARCARLLACVLGGVREGGRAGVVQCSAVPGAGAKLS